MAEQATHGFTRRSFIKGAAALTATGALVGCSPQTQNLEKAEPQKGAPRDANLLRCLPLPMRPGLLSGCPCSRRAGRPHHGGPFRGRPGIRPHLPQGALAACARIQL